VPRLVAPLMQRAETPLVPPEQWETTRVILPEGVLDDLIHEFTGESVTITHTGTERSIALSHLLEVIPAALLTGEASQ